MRVVYSSQLSGNTQSIKEQALSPDKLVSHHEDTPVISENFVVTDGVYSLGKGYTGFSANPDSYFLLKVTEVLLYRLYLNGPPAIASLLWTGAEVRGNLKEDLPFIRTLALTDKS